MKSENLDCEDFYEFGYRLKNLLEKNTPSL